MGEAKRRRTATQQFIRQFPNCYFCGGQRPATTREHMPPKSLFDNSHRPDKLVMPACTKCNRGTSTADLTVAVISRWEYENQPQELSDHMKLVRQVVIQAFELLKEWTIVDPLRREEAREHLRSNGYLVPRDAGIASIGPLTIRQLNLFAHKATLALYFEKFRQPLPRTGRIFAFWRTKEDIARNGIPQRLIDLLPQYGTLVQGRWDERETFEYKYDTNAEAGLFGCFAKLRTRFFVGGFAVADASILPFDDPDWINPADPLILLDCPRFREKR